MIKFKRLAFITVIVVATLLAIGNLTTLAQANSSDDIFTPTPTGSLLSTQMLRVSQYL